LKPRTRSAWLGIGLGAVVTTLAGVFVFLSEIRALLSGLVATVLTMFLYLPATPIESDPLIRNITLGLFAVFWGGFVVLPVALLGGVLGALVGRSSR
jgi:Na+/proline symporter